MCQTFEIAKYDRRAILVGQMAQLQMQPRALVNLRGRIHPAAVTTYGSRQVFDGILSGYDASRPPRRQRPRSRRDAKSDAVEPVAQEFAPADGFGLLDQYQECCLKRIVDIIGVTQQMPADPQNHGTVTRHQRFKGGLVTSVILRPTRFLGLIAL